LCSCACRRRSASRAGREFAAGFECAPSTSWFSSRRRGNRRRAEAIAELEHLADLLQSYFADYGYWTIAFALLLENAGVPMPGETVLHLVPLFHKVDVVLGAAVAAAAVWLWWKYRRNRESRRHYGE
jgi:membrane protein DedA with SNARE-associated domain